MFWHCQKIVEVLRFWSLPDLLEKVWSASSTVILLQKEIVGTNVVHFVLVTLKARYPKVSPSTFKNVIRKMQSQQLLFRLKNKLKFNRLKRPPRRPPAPRAPPRRRRPRRRPRRRKHTNKWKKLSKAREIIPNISFDLLQFIWKYCYFICFCTFYVLELTFFSLNL